MQCVPHVRSCVPRAPLMIKNAIVITHTIHNTNVTYGMAITDNHHGEVYNGPRAVEHFTETLNLCYFSYYFFHTTLRYYLYCRYMYYTLFTWLLSIWYYFKTLSRTRSQFYFRTERRSIIDWALYIQTINIYIYIRSTINRSLSELLSFSDVHFFYIFVCVLYCKYISVLYFVHIISPFGSQFCTALNYFWSQKYVKIYVFNMNIRMPSLFIIITITSYPSYHAHPILSSCIFHWHISLPFLFPARRTSGELMLVGKCLWFPPMSRIRFFLKEIMTPNIIR